jgi:hypothetical protein
MGVGVGVLVVDPRVEVPRRVPIRVVEPDSEVVVPPDTDVVPPDTEVVVPPDTDVVVEPDVRPSICWRICISRDNDPPEDVVDVVVVVVVAPHCVPDVGADGVLVVVPSLEVPYSPREVRSENVVGVVVVGAVTTVVVVPHPGSVPDPLARSSLTTLGGIAT